MVMMPSMVCVVETNGHRCTLRQRTSNSSETIKYSVHYTLQQDGGQAALMQTLQQSPYHLRMWLACSTVWSNAS